LLLAVGVLVDGQAVSALASLDTLVEVLVGVAVVVLGFRWWYRRAVGRRPPVARLPD
jgi:hypothetical protein